MTSFSTGRNDSASSLSSSMPPAFSSQSSFSYAAMGRMPFPGHPDFFNQSGLDFTNFGGSDHDLRHGGSMFQTEDDDDEEFGGLFDRSRKF
jgi:hypothetical protein